MSEEKRAHERSESQPDYIRVLSHQLKSPISSIQSLLNTITEGFTGEIPPKTRYFIEKALNRADEAKTMISDLLDYEIYSQHQAAVREEYTLSSVLSPLLSRYVSMASEEKISLHTELPPDCEIEVFGDSRGMEHALRNLIENAIKYTPADGWVSIAIRVNDAEKQCRIDISDSGYGIPAEEIEMVFEPFYRSLKHKSNISGTGLGLPIAKKVIESHHGSISLESEPNKGSTFTILLPYVRLISRQTETARRKKVVIIGGVAAGPKAAARLRRLDEELDITIIEKREFLSYSGCGLPSYISNKVRSPRALMSTDDNTLRDVNFFASISKVNVLDRTVALAVNRKKKLVTVQNLIRQAISEVPYDILILATGSEFFMPKIPGIWQKGVYSLHSLEEAEALNKEFSQKSAQDVYIIGGGLIGTSTAESLIETGARVTILEREAHLLPRLLDRDLALKLETELSKKGIKVVSDATIKEIEKSKTHLTIVTKDDSYYSNLIILSSGLRPNTILAEKAGLEIGKSGAIEVNEHLQTSDPAIYAIGDCAEKINGITQQHEYWSFGSTSTKMGRIAADHICGIPSRCPGSIGTAMFKIFDLNVARTGLTFQKALEGGFEPVSVTVTGLDRAYYYGDAEVLILKVIADKKSKTLLGAQGFGKGDIVARIQVLACGINQSLSLEGIFDLDLGYAPAFNNPIDMAQTACLVLNNKIDGYVETITAEDFETEKENFDGIVDVSPLSDHSFNAIPGSLNVPLENLRREKIPFEKAAKVLLYSRNSAGAYKAYRILHYKGYSNLQVLEGGYAYWGR